ncbi:hypothetical protein [Xanthomonas sp. LF06-19]|uniref:hypothetical protein n=1 Tax=Xanthomonas sp. LF06-19 TaxID=3097551 RepID=UPI002A7F86FB|nr:hypothetical protein [Xanthomonas sp. LF06-19]MDY4284367.1 hypothetical protein [Xanthomonas sp. LF06-19]
MEEQGIPTGKQYQYVKTYKCNKDIYFHGLSFLAAGRLLYKSEDKKLFTPAMINICLATEILLKSINVKHTWIADEVKFGDTIAYIGRDSSLKITSSNGHHLSKLFRALPDETQLQISEIAKKESYKGDIASGLEAYDKAFVDWRYIYEKIESMSLGTYPLFKICDAINTYCEISHTLSPSVESQELTQQ